MDPSHRFHISSYDLQRYIYIYIPRSFLANILSQHSFHSSLQLLAHFSLSSLVTKRTHAIISTRTIRFASRLLPLSVLSLPSYIVRSGVQFLSYTRSRTHAYSLSLSLSREKNHESQKVEVRPSNSSNNST